MTKRKSDALPIIDPVVAGEGHATWVAMIEERVCQDTGFLRVLILFARARHDVDEFM